LRADLECKHVEAIADRVGQDRLPLPRCVGWAAWEDAPVRQALRRQVAPPLGQADGVLVLDPSALPQSGTDAGGVARPWCGRWGTVDHGHGARALGDVSREGPTVVGLRLSLPQTWTPDTARLDKAGGPHDRRGYR
jgi:SRSO17 transposase